jgi:hypothetical protein
MRPTSPFGRRRSTANDEGGIRAAFGIPALLVPEMRVLQADARPFIM